MRTSTIWWVIAVVGSVAVPALDAAAEEETSVVADISAVALPLERVAFGSCNHQEKEQPLWPMVQARRPQLWLWMGDAIYGDYREFLELRTYLPPFPIFRDASPEMLTEKYNLQVSNPDYAQLRSQVPIIGVWDDHDYGRNDGDNSYKYRRESQQIFLDFLGEHPESPRRTQEGAYAAHMIGSGEQAVKFILLDVRYHKDPYGVPGGDFLGETQWKWFENELVSSSAAFNVIVSGVQILPQDRFYGGENWNRFPRQRDRFINLILKSNARGVVLLSGDVHFAEINQIQCDDYRSMLTEITSSGMTHSWDTERSFLPLRAILFRVANLILPWEFRRHRNDFFGLKNFGEIVFDWSSTPLPTATVRVLGEDNSVKLEYTTSSHYLEHSDEDNPSKTCHSIHAQLPPVVLIRRAFLVGVVGLIVAAILTVAVATVLLPYLLGRSLYFFARDLRRLQYQKVD